MKKSLLSSAFILALSGMAVNAQTFNPAAGSALTAGQSGVAYAGQTINVVVPTTTNVTGAQILAALPSSVTSLLPAGTVDPNSEYPVTVTSVIFSMSGLPSGVNSDCNNCSVNGGATRNIVLAGTPTAAGSFLIDITSLTAGTTSIAGFDIPFGSAFTFPGLPFPIDIPRLAGVMDAEDYTMSVAHPASIAEYNSLFALTLYPNPTERITTLDVNSTVGGVATVEIFSITGSMVQRTSRTIASGMNRLSLDLSAMPAGIYMVRTEINGKQALVRVQKA